MTQIPDSGARFDGNDLKQMFAAATGLFQHSTELLNALNVFPVPDGDTGTNMFLTLTDTLAKAEENPSASAGEVASAMAEGALWGAKGNSGVILSQFFKGIAQGFQDRDDFGPQEFSEALQSAREYAYKAVGDPKEGTMLTVLRYVADSSREAAIAVTTMTDMLDAVCDAATEAVALTPTMLPVLRQAGVVDAGGHGLLVILQGMRLSMAGQELPQAEIAPPEAIGVEEGAGVVSEDFLVAAEEELYGYCTQLLIEGAELDIDDVRSYMITMARSTVVIGDAKALKVHVHAHDPGPVISYAVSLGTLSQVKIESMDEQHKEFSAARREEPAQTAHTLPTAIVAVAWGEGLEAMFTGMGAAGILTSGDTMNPSVRDIMEAVDAAPSDNVIFLPNNGNIVQAARQAVGVSGKSLRVVGSRSIPQGVAAILAFNPHIDIDENVKEMEEALASVKTGEVCQAVRPVELNGVAVEEGQIIGILERELVAAGDDPNEVLLALLKEADVAEGHLVTLYSGEPVTEQAAAAAGQRVESTHPGVEVEVVNGGQPYYHYIVSVE